MEINSKTFHRLVDAASSGLDWKEIGTAMAELSPDTFVAAIGLIQDGGWKTQVEAMVGDGAERYEIIKFVRDATSMSLRDAKNWVEQTFPEVPESE